MRKRQGFTLVEMMAIVSIIGIMAGVWFMSTGTYIPDSHDGKRQADLAMLQAALIVYEEAKESYPNTGGAWWTSEPGDSQGIGSPLPNNNGNWIPGLAPEFISKLPRDPKGGPSTTPGCVNGEFRAFRYKSDGQHGYKLLSNCSVEGSITTKLGGHTENSMQDPIRPNTAWMVCSPGPACIF